MIDFMISRSYLLIQPYSLDFELFIQFKINKIELIFSLQSTLKWPVNRLVSKVYTELIFFFVENIDTFDIRANNSVCVQQTT